MNDSEENVVFRSQFSGYNREDVNGYIEESNIKFERAESAYRKTITAQQSQIDELKKQLAGKASDETNRLLEEERAKTASLETELEASKAAAQGLNTELESAKGQTAAANRELAAARDRATALEAKANIIGDKLTASENALAAEREKSADAVKKLELAGEELEKLKAENEVLYGELDGLKKHSDETNGYKAEAKRLSDETGAENAKPENVKGDSPSAGKMSSPTAAEYADAIDGMSERIAALTDENDRLLAALTAKDDSIAQLTGERDSVMNELSSAMTKLEQLNTSKLDEADKVIREVGSSDGSESDAEKVRLYDKVSRQLGSMLIDAREIADGIISDANAKADKTLRAAENEASSVRADADEKLRRASAYIEQSMKRLSSDCSAEYLKYVSGIRDAFNRQLDENTEDQKKVLSRFESLVSAAEKDMSEGIKKITAPEDGKK